MSVFFRSWMLLLAVVVLSACRPDTGNSPRVTVVRIGTIEHKRIKESSGIIASPTYPGIFWTHNDKGNSPMIYALTRKGRSVAEYRLDIDNDDWEDISADEQGRLYIASTGNNDGKRKEIEVLRIEEPKVSEARKDRSRRIKDITIWRLTYPGQPFDCESLFIHQGFGYLVSKVSDDRRATIYRFSLTESVEPIVLEEVTDLPVYTPVTAAAISRDGVYLAVLSRGELYVFRIDGNVAIAGQVQPIRIPLPSLQFESCCFAKDGVILTAESREIFLVPASAYK